MPSKNPQVRAIELEASRRAAADGTTSHKERFAIRKALRADAGLGKEQKQRGGVAGAYDRNKAYVLPIAAAIAGLTGVGGAFMPAILGGLQGFDRPGEGGIGFDVNSGLKGAATGLAAGGLGAAAGNALNIGVGAIPAATAGTAGAAASAAPAAASALPSAVPAAVPAASAPGGIMGSLGSLAGKAKDFALADGGKNIMGIIGAVDAASQRRRADDLTNRAIGLDTGRWDAGAPLRQQGLDALTAGIPGNPFAAQPVSGAIPEGPSPGVPPVLATPRRAVPANIPRALRAVRQGGR